MLSRWPRGNPQNTADSSTEGGVLMIGLKTHMPTEVCVVTAMRFRWVGGNWVAYWADLDGT